ncbi:hypothetical protein RCL_jg21414.t1 [Rhizophagus clarus]|uniref:Uncharacterized protein n=1 Tax=Rhizophagus clarus TaxID=94130 RepID=A0A8H3LRP9_9GLOM|nr:hypothetical protein RCL_jg21414.t1 [Rhizophagus clarus]
MTLKSVNTFEFFSVSPSVYMKLRKIPLINPSLSIKDIFPAFTSFNHNEILEYCSSQHYFLAYVAYVKPQMIYASFIRLAYRLVNSRKRASIAALWRSLQYLGITRKKLQKAALERNEIC